MNGTENKGVLHVPARMDMDTPMREMACLTCGLRIWNIDKALDTVDVELFAENHKGHELTVAEFAAPPVCRPPLPGAAPEPFKPKE